IVAQRLSEMKSMESEPPGMKPKVDVPDLPRLAPQPGKRSLNLRGDTRTVYEQLAALFGVKATFDADLKPRNVRIKLEDVDFYTAASVLASQTGTFWIPANDQMMYVMPDTPAKRKEYEPEAQQTFSLSSAVGTEEMTELLRVLREITGATHVQLDSRSRTITMRDTSDKLALAAEVIRNMEGARGEMMLEFELLEVDSDAARKLGVDSPSQARLFSIPSNIQSQLSQAKDLRTLLTLLAGVFGTPAA